MNIQSFLQHHGLSENPFEGEEARHDPVFERLMASSSNHPDFDKIIGWLDRPSTSVVFGEKGSGKTAIRLRIGQKVTEHNGQQSEGRILLVPYDDMNPVLDRLMHHRQRKLGLHLSQDAKIEKLLSEIRLEDHQDAILSLALTPLVDAMLSKPVDYRTDGNEKPQLPSGWVNRVKKMSRQRRVDLAVMAAIYDQPRSGSSLTRWFALHKKLRLRRLPRVLLLELFGTIFTILTVALFVASETPYGTAVPEQLLLSGASVFAGVAVLIWVLWGMRQITLWWLARQICKEVLAGDRSGRDLRVMFGAMRRSDLWGIPWPTATLRGSGQDSRYQLTSRLLDSLESLGYRGMMVLVDRVDEPMIVRGNPQRMRSLIWTMFDNKFLQQERVGLKLLLPIELRHLLHRESPDFFQEARLDKQNLVDRLTWSGVTLYDLCSMRLGICRCEAGVSDAGAASNSDPPSGGEDGAAEPPRINLMSLFEPDVTREMLVDALDQMHQPRDAFKFLYSVIQEHCRTVPEGTDQYQIPRLVLDAVRRSQSQRVQDLYRGLSPA